MARPAKKGVEYFPHQCISGQTLFILEENFGNNGYSTWFKLLEVLGTKEGHFIDCNNPADLHFLASKCKLPVVSVTEILDLLATLDAIDSELWSEKVIWCQNFVDGIEGVYEKRKQKPPVRPRFCHENPSLAGISVTVSTQSKVEKSKVEKSKVEKSNSAPNGAPPKPAGKLKVSDPDQQPLQQEYQTLVTQVAEMTDDKERKKLLADFIVSKQPFFHEPYVDLWNLSAVTTGLAKVKILSRGRLNKFNTRIREPAFEFIGILSEIRKSPFLQGKSDNKRTWKVDWDWVFENDTNYLQILEGKFNN